MVSGGCGGAGARRGLSLGADMDLPRSEVYSWNPLMKPRLILFDLDGTLVDSAPDIARALNATMAELGVAPLPVPQVIGYVGDGAAKLVERATGSEPADPKLVDTFRRHY